VVVVVVVLRGLCEWVVLAVLLLLLRLLLLRIRVIVVVLLRMHLRGVDDRREHT